MKLDLDSRGIELTCPSCGQKFPEKIGRLKHNPTLPCPGCKTPIHIKADQLRRSIETVQKDLDTLGRNLGKLFK